MSINIRIEKKEFWLFAAIIVALVGVGYVIAGNPGSKPNPGHASNEIMININGADKTLQAAIDDGDFLVGVGGTSCRTIMTTGTTEKKGWTPLDVPTNCRSRPCKLVASEFKVKDSVNVVTNIKFGDYYQTEYDLDPLKERWETSGNIGEKSGLNGDSTESEIVSLANNYIQLMDDKATETEKSKWAYRDDSDKFGMILKTCNY